MVIAIAVIATIGWEVYKHNSNQQAPVSQQTTTAKDSNKHATNNAAHQYLAIKEWGIKLPLSDPIADAYYVASTSSQDSNGQPNTVWLGLKSLDANDCEASNPNNGKSPVLAALLRNPVDATDPVSGASYRQLYPNGKTIDGYYYAYDDKGTLSSGCSSLNNLTNIDNAFKAAANNIVAE